MRSFFFLTLYSIWVDTNKPRICISAKIGRKSAEKSNGSSKHGANNVEITLATKSIPIEEINCFHNSFPSHCARRCSGLLRVYFPNSFLPVPIPKVNISNILLCIYKSSHARKFSYNSARIVNNASFYCSFGHFVGVLKLICRVRIFLLHERLRLLFIFCSI